MSPKYPEVTVQLSGEDGDGFFNVIRVRTAMRRAGLSDAVIIDFSEEATSGDYDHLLQTCMKWVTVK